MTVEVFIADISMASTALHAYLDPVETARLQTYRKDGDRARFLVGAVLLRLVAHRLLNGRTQHCAERQSPQSGCVTGGTLPDVDVTISEPSHRGAASQSLLDARGHHVLDSTISSGVRGVSVDCGCVLCASLSCGGQGLSDDLVDELRGVSVDCGCVLCASLSCGGHALSGHLVDQLRSIPVSRTCSTCGKPHGRPVIPGLNVSVSHSELLVVIAATTRDMAVGVDVMSAVEWETNRSEGSCEPTEHGHGLGSRQGQVNSQGLVGVGGEVVGQGLGSRQGQVNSQGLVGVGGEVIGQGLGSRQGQVNSQGLVRFGGEVVGQDLASMQRQPGSSGEESDEPGRDAVLETRWMQCEAAFKCQQTYEATSQPLSVAESQATNASRTTDANIAQGASFSLTANQFQAHTFFPIAMSYAQYEGWLALRSTQLQANPDVNIVIHPCNELINAIQP